jgi:hypothetical protein
MLPQLFFLDSGQFGQLLENIKNNFFYIFITSDTSIFTRKVMIYSIFISEVNNMMNFVLRVIGKNNI